MNKNKPIPSFWMELLGNTCIAVLAGLSMAIIGDPTLEKMASRAGLGICYVSALLAAYSILLKPRYAARERELLEKAVNDSKDEEPIYKELGYIYEFNSRSRAHLILSLVLVGVGTGLQIFGST